ncbi:MAG: HdaA/DnaA family protein [Hyphomicrobiaceae bacterium]
MNTSPEQLVLDLPHQHAFGEDDFLVSPSNAAAVALIDRWPDWESTTTIICGPPGSGKSHLASVFLGRTGGRSISAGDLCDDDEISFSDFNSLVVEDIHFGVGSEKALFHLINYSRENKRSLLLTSRVFPGELSIDLPDLRSRLRALPMTAIEPPDEPLLHALLVKMFSDRQLVIKPATVKYILSNMERSAEAAVRLVAELDHAALKKQRKVTKLLAREVIYKLFPANS